MPYSIRPVGNHGSGELILEAPFDYFLGTLADLADQGSFLRLKVAAPDLPDNDNEYVAVWARDFPVPKPSLPRWLREELALLKRDAKGGARRHAYADAQRLGLYSRKSTLGRVEKIRYLRPEDLELLPQPYPERETWDRTEWVPYDATFIAELAEKQRFAPSDRWLGPALRRAGSRVQWLTLAHAAFLSVEEYDELSAKPCNRKCAFPATIDLVHPTEGQVCIYAVPATGHIATIMFQDRALLCFVE